MCGSHEDFVYSLAHVDEWDTSGGKSGASFFRSMDHRYVVKHITATEFQVRSKLSHCRFLMSICTIEFLGGCSFVFRLFWHIVLRAEKQFSR